MFNVIFHVGIKEPPSAALLRWLEERKNGKHENSKFGRNNSQRKGKHFAFELTRFTRKSSTVEIVLIKSFPQI